jgi:ATP-dependent Lon protease
LPTTFGFHGSGNSAQAGQDDAIGKNAWEDRVVAERDVEVWLSEYPSTFITVAGPPGSGKASLVSRVLKQQNKWVKTEVSVG